MKKIFIIAILFLPFIAKSQPQFIDVGEKIVRVDFCRGYYGLENLDVVSSLIAAINSATDAGLLKWEKVAKDSTHTSMGIMTYIRESVKNTIVFGLAKEYKPKTGEIVVGDEDGIWKARNLDLVIFFQLYFFGIKNESK